MTTRLSSTTEKYCLEKNQLQLTPFIFGTKRKHETKAEKYVPIDFSSFLTASFENTQRSDEWVFFAVDLLVGVIIALLRRPEICPSLCQLVPLTFFKSPLTRH